ncbi:hypothetical protein ACQU0X_00970 [Pseudovibrio ascidiaceicola]|uniref:hypothetical protein n=1 Tax=Pseudovibrio ascidiaceicola TaxID=285279 RepID=UPI003D35D177
MSDGYNFKQLKENILLLSNAHDWEVAKKEWSLVSIMTSDQPSTCLCGHNPIIDICTIQNQVTGKVAEVGNICIKRFFGIRSDLIFSAVKRIQKNPDKSLNADSIVFFHQKKAINDWEYGFLQDTLKKRKLSPRQLSTRRSINQKILNFVSQTGLS